MKKILKEFICCLILVLTTNIAFGQAQIVDFSPPTEMLQRGQESQAIVTVKNIGSSTRSFWVGLSFAHKTTSSEEWPTGWYDIYPVQVELTPGQRKSVILNFSLHESIVGGEYYATSAVWGSFNQDTYLMEERLDDTRNYSKWVDLDGLGMLSFSLDSSGQTLKDIPAQFLDFISTLTSEVTMDVAYENGRKPLLMLSAGKDYTIGGIPVSAGGALFFDLADLCEITPEGKAGFVSMWKKASLGAVSKNGNLLPKSVLIGGGLIYHDFNPREPGLADYLPTTLSFGNVSTPFFSFSVCSISSIDSVEWFSVVPNGTTGVGLSIEEASLDLGSCEIQKDILLSALSPAVGLVQDAYLSAQEYSDVVMERLENLLAGSVLDSCTLDDGDIPVALGDWNGPLEASVRYGISLVDNFYKVEIPEGQKKLSIISKDATGSGGLAMRYGSRPDHYLHDEEYTQSTSIPGTLVVQNPPSGTYYFSVGTTESYQNCYVSAICQSTHSLTVNAFYSISVQVVPDDTNGLGSDATPFNRTYFSGETVTLTAPYSAGDRLFKEWRVGENYYSSARSISVMLNADKTVEAIYENEPTGDLEVAGSENPETLEISIAPGNGRCFGIHVFNTGQSSVTVDCSKSGAAANWATLESSSFALEGQEFRRHKVTINVPDETDSGVYSLNVKYNSVTYPIAIRVAASGDDYFEKVDSGSVWVNGNNSATTYVFDNSSYTSFAISGKYQTFAQTYLRLSKSEYLNAGDYRLHVSVNNLNADAKHDLKIYMNNEYVGQIQAEKVAKGSSSGFFINNIDWASLVEGLNVVTFKLSSYDSSDETQRWQIHDTIFITTDKTTSAWGAPVDIDIPYNIWDDIKDGFMKNAKLYANVDQVGSEGKIYLFNNGEEVASNTIKSSDSGDDEYWSLSKSELEEDNNYFVLKGDTSTEPRVLLSNMKLVITFNNADPVLEIVKELGSNQVQVGEQVGVTVTVVNTREGSTTGYDTDLRDGLPDGLKTVSGSLNKNCSKIDFEEMVTNTYKVKGSQPGRYILPSARIAYENIDGDDFIDESSIAILEVSGGALDVVETVQLQTNGADVVIACAADVLAAGGSHIADADVVANLYKDNIGSWDLVEEWSLGYDPQSSTYTAQSPPLEVGDYKVVINASREFYDDGQSGEHLFSIVPTYRLTVIKGAGGGSAYTNGQAVTITADQPLLGKVFDRWIGATQHISSAISPQTTVTMPASNITVEAAYMDKYYSLNVVSEYGVPVPSTGESRIKKDSIVDCLVTSFDEQGTTRYLSEGWAMTGNEPFSGTANSFSMTITNDASLVWFWSTNYYLTVVTSTNGTVDVSNGWKSADSTLILTADPDSGHKVKHWLMNDEVTAKGQKKLTVEITEPTVIQVFFEKIKAMPWLNLLLE